ncbi:MAG: hypothetical protein AAFY26_20100 [Cyanobacteria bacterium J06638_22]
MSVPPQIKNALVSVLDSELGQNLLCKDVGDVSNVEDALIGRNPLAGMLRQERSLIIRRWCRHND